MMSVYVYYDSQVLTTLGACVFLPSLIARERGHISSCEVNWAGSMKINPDDVRRKVLEALRKQVSSAWPPDSAETLRTW